MKKDLAYYLERTVSKDDCLVWTKAVNTDGYPRSVINGNYNGKVHREVFFLTNGFYPEVVRHSCDNPLCINPDHLEAGSQLDNIKDRVTRGRTSGHISNEIISAIFSLRKDGLSYKEIAKSIGRSHKTVDYVLYKHGKGKG